MPKHNFPKKIYPEDILKVLNGELKTSEIIQRLQASKEVEGDYDKITQSGVLRVLDKMAKNGSIEGDKSRFGFWMWKTKEQEK